jgi:trimeric autotransporter adhesin
LGQAAVKKFFIATFLERKIMSTKTSFKRIALVAASALAIAGFSAVPASAATVDLGVDAITVTTPTATANVGDLVSTTFSVSLDAASAGTKTAGLISSIVKPTDSALTVADGSTSAGTQPTITDTSTAAALTSAVYTSPKTKLTAAGVIAADASTVAGTISFRVDVPGTYTYTLKNATAADDAVAGSVAATFTVTVRSLSYTSGDVAAATPFDTGSSVAGNFNSVTVTGYATGASGVRAMVEVSGAGATIASGTNTPTIAADFKSALITAQSSSALVIRTPQVGTVTVKLFNETGNATGQYSATAANTVTITVGAATVAGVYAASTAYMNTASTAPTKESDATTAATAPIAAASATAGTPIANIKVSQVDAQATPVNVATADTKAIVYEIAGAGALGTSGSASIGSYIAVAAGSANDNIVYIHPDGRSGTGTVTVTVNGVLVSTKKVSFYGAAAKYTATTQYIASANGAASTDAVVVCAEDKNGIAVPSATILATSGATTVATVAASATTVASAVTTSGTIPTSYVAAKAIGCAGFAVTGLAQTTASSVTITFANAATAPTVTTTAVVNVGSVAATTVALTSDATSYAAGSKITLTLTFKDSVGRLVAGGVGTGTLAAALTSSSNLSGAALFDTANASKLGVTTAVVYAPLSGGPVTLTGTTGTNATYLATAAQGQALALELAIEGDSTASLALDAANAATDAANNAYDEAQNATQAASDALAAVTALAKQVKSLIASVKKLTAAVAKLK